MTLITKDFLKTAGIFCLFLLLQLLIPLVAWGLSSLPTFAGTVYNIPGVKNATFNITIPAIAFSFFVMQLAFVLLLHFTGWVSIKLFSGKSANFGFSGMPIFHFVGVFVVLSMGIQLMLQPLHLDDGNTNAMFKQLSSNIWGVLSLTILGTLVEELIFRAGIFQLTRKHLGNIGAMFLSSLLFGLVHLNWYQVIPAFFLGFVLAYLYLRTEDLRLCWSAHIANNALAVLAFHYAPLDHLGEQWPVWQQVGVGALMVVMGGFGLLMKGSLLKKLFGRAKG